MSLENQQEQYKNSGNPKFFINENFGDEAVPAFPSEPTEASKKLPYEYPKIFFEGLHFDRFYFLSNNFRPEFFNQLPKRQKIKETLG